MSEGKAVRIPRWDLNLGELEALLEDEGWDGIDELECACRLRHGRIQELADNGWSPYFWEFRAMALVLDMDMDELAEAIFDVRERG